MTGENETMWKSIKSGHRISSLPRLFGLILSTLCFSFSFASALGSLPAPSFPSALQSAAHFPVAPGPSSLFSRPLGDVLGAVALHALYINDPFPPPPHGRARARAGEARKRERARNPSDGAAQMERKARVFMCKL